MKIDGRELFLESYRCAKREKRDFLLENEAAEICRSYDLPLPDNGFAESKEAAFSVASKLGYPVVVKLVSPQVIHKSDVGAVRVGVDSRDQLARAWDQILGSVREHQPEADIKGFMIARMAGEGVETIVGLKRDQVFGPVVMFGIGGVLVEIYKDVTVRVCPVDDSDVEEMMGEIRGRKLLEGFRGLPKANLEALKKVILVVSTLGMENPEVGSIDLNPVRVNEKEALVLDTRIILQ